MTLLGWLYGRWAVGLGLNPGQGPRGCTFPASCSVITHLLLGNCHREVLPLSPGPPALRWLLEAALPATLPDPTPWGPLTPPCQLTGPLPTLTTGPAHSRPGPQHAHLRHVLLGPTHLVLSVLWLPCTPPLALPHSRQPRLQSSRQGFGASCHPSNPPQALLFPLNCLSCCGGSYS